MVVSEKKLVKEDKKLLTAIQYQGATDANKDRIEYPFFSGFISQGILSWLRDEENNDILFVLQRERRQEVRMGDWLATVYQKDGPILKLLPNEVVKSYQEVAPSVWEDLFAAQQPEGKRA